jgi:hypothetical protein
MTTRETSPSSRAEPAGADTLEARIAAEKANISDTLRLFSQKAESEWANREQKLSDYALPPCGGAAVLGFLPAPRRRRRPEAVVTVRAVPAAPEEQAPEPRRRGLRIADTLTGLAGGVLLSVATRYLSDLLTDMISGGSPDAEARHPAIEEYEPEPFGSGIPPEHVGPAVADIPTAPVFRVDTPPAGTAGMPIPGSHGAGIP